MMADGLETYSEPRISPAQLKDGKARDLALLLESNTLPYVELVDCKAVPDDRYETVVLRIHVEVGQRPVHDIRRTEPMSVKFDVQDEIAPQIFALREDFPQVPHLNLQEQEYPRSLCLYDEPYDEIKLRWTPVQFLARLSGWLRDTAEGTLHRQDQALEPLLMSEDLNTLVVHPGVFDNQERALFTWVSVSQLQCDSRWPTAIVTQTADPAKITHLLTMIPVPPQTHGIISRLPKSFFELHQFLESTGVDLLNTWRLLLRESRQQPGIEKIDDLIGRTEVILLLSLPKKRTEEGDIESIEFRAFVCENASTHRIGEEIGIWETANGGIGLLLQTDETKNGSNISLRPANCTFICQRDDLIRFADIKSDAQNKFVCIGVGALGSQVISNSARMGFGTWTIVDSDVLLPHNIARHALTPEHIGKWKATSMAEQVNSILADMSAATGIPANVLKPSSYEEQLVQALKKSDVIIDMSTSVAASRWLACDCPSSTRRASLFLNPAGTDLVLLTEDADRKVALDCLEMQYYRHLISHPELYANHLSSPDDGVRYGNTCRDVSSRIPQDIIAVMAGIGSRALRLAVSDQKAKIAIWHSKDQWLRIDVDDVDVQPVVKVISDDWTIITDHYVLGKALDLRKTSLPNETGGILVGSFDAQRRLVYIVDILPAPPDSKEGPGSFERGVEGLAAKRKEINDISAGWLDYVGEWHSHPSGCSCNRSPADCRQCNWIAGNMQIEGLPGLMMIVNEGGYMLYLTYTE